MSYNVASNQYIPVVCELPDHLRVLVPMRWGLVLSWQKEEDISSAMINARVETISTKPAFRRAISESCFNLTIDYINPILHLKLEN